MDSFLLRGVVLSLAATACASSFAQVNLVNETFKGSTAAGWTLVNGQGAGPTLTSGVADPVGKGWLRLTNNVQNQSSFVYRNDPIATAGGLKIQFDFAIWGGGSPNGADGFTFAIFDAKATPSAGGYGGSLGYAQRSGIDGLAGGIVGFGFDEFGNYSKNSEGRVGGLAAQTPNAVVIRGSQGATRRDGYAYITGTGTQPHFSFPQITGGPTSRSDTYVHSVRITIPTDKKISVEMWDKKMVNGKENWETLINAFQCSLTCPDSVKIGFTAGTGSVTNYHEISNLSVTSVTSAPEAGTCLLALVSLPPLLMQRRRIRRHGNQPATNAIPCVS